MIRARDIRIISSSPQMVPPPLELRQAYRRREGLSPSAWKGLAVAAAIWAVVAVCCWAGLR